MSRSNTSNPSVEISIAKAQELLKAMPALGYLAAAAAGAAVSYVCTKRSNNQSVKPKTHNRKPTMWQSVSSILDQKQPTTSQSHETQTDASTNSTSTSTTTANKSDQQLDPLDPEWFREHGHELVDWITDYRARLNDNMSATPDANGRVELPIQCQLQPGWLAKSLPNAAPESPESWQSVMTDVENLIVPGLTHWQSPHFYAWFKNHASFPSFLGDMLSDCFSSVGFSWLSSPASAELEAIVMDWMAKLMSLPNHFLTSSGQGGGTICLTAGEAAIIAILTAKRATVERHLGERASVDVTEEQIELEKKFVVYVSDQAHGIIQRAAKVISIPSSRIRVIKCSKQNEYRMQAEDVEAAMKEDEANGLIPFFLWLTTGTTSTGAVDDTRSLTACGHRHNAWVHADAAYGGCFALLPELKRMFDFSQCDSLNFNAHKGLFTHFDCAFLWVNERRHLINSLTLVSMPYLKNAFTDSGQVIDYKDWGLSFGRRFRSLKVWCLLRVFGVERLRRMLRDAIDFATMIGQHLYLEDGRFEPCAPQVLSLLCFRARLSKDQTQEELNELNTALMDRCNASGQIFFSKTSMDGDIVLRIATSGAEHVDHIMRDARVICQQLTELLEERKQSAQS